MQDHAKSAATRTRGTHLWKRSGLHFAMDLDVTPIEGEINLQLKVAPWLYFFCLIIYVDFVFFAYVLQNVWFHTLVSFVQTFVQNRYSGRC